MLRLFKAFLFRLKRDIGFKVILIVGVSLAVFLTIVYAILEGILNHEEMDMGIRLLTGEAMLLSSFNPAQNFGLAIPSALVTFIVAEFTNGTIRNKIIAGNSKAKIYTSLFLTALILTISLLLAYASLTTLLGTIFGGGFRPTEGTQLVSVSSLFGTTTNQYLIRLCIVAIFSYITICSFTVLVSTLLRHIGPSIPLVIISIVLLSLMGTILNSLGMIGETSAMETFIKVLRVVDPLYALSEQTLTFNEVTNETLITMRDDTFVASIISNVVYSVIFYIIGLVAFIKRDIK